MVSPELPGRSLVWCPRNYLALLIAFQSPTLSHEKP